MTNSRARLLAAEVMKRWRHRYGVWRNVQMLEDKLNIQDRDYECFICDESQGARRECCCLLLLRCDVVSTISCTSFLEIDYNKLVLRKHDRKETCLQTLWSRSPWRIESHVDVHFFAHLLLCHQLYLAATISKRRKASMARVNEMIAIDI